MITQWQVVLRGTSEAVPTRNGQFDQAGRRRSPARSGLICDRRVLSSDPRAITWWRELRWLRVVATLGEARARRARPCHAPVAPGSPDGDRGQTGGLSTDVH